MLNFYINAVKYGYMTIEQVPSRYVEQMKIDTDLQQEEKVDTDLQQED